MSQSTEHYLVISSDCHAGLPNVQYREYLDPEYRDVFDQSLVAREALDAEMREHGACATRSSPRSGKRENEEGLRGGWDAARRDKELDADGVAGEIIFPDADAVAGGASAPFGAGLGESGDSDPDAPARRRPGPQPLARRAVRRRARAARAASPLVPIIGDVDAAVAEIRRGPRVGLRGGILIPSTWAPHPPYHDARYEPVWAACQDLDMPVHVHSGAADRESYGEYVGIYVAEVRWWSTRPALVPHVVGRVRALPAAEVRRRRVRRVLGDRPALDDGHRSTTASTRRRSSAHSSTAQPEDAAERVLRPQLLDRRVEHAAARARPALRDRRRQHHVGQRLPAPRGHVAAHPRVVAQGVLGPAGRRHRGRSSVSNAAGVYNFDVDALAPLADRIGPTPADLGQTGDNLEKWADLAAAGRPWITGIGD